MQDDSSPPSKNNAVSPPTSDSPSAALTDASVVTNATEQTPFDEQSNQAKVPAVDAEAPLSGWPSISSDRDKAAPATVAGSDRSSALGGCSTGALSLMPFLFVLAAMRQAGLPIDASSMVALVAGAILMAVALKSWPRRTTIWLGGYVVGLLAAYALLWFLVRPLIVASIAGAPATSGQSTVPAPNNFGDPNLPPS